MQDSQKGRYGQYSDTREEYSGSKHNVSMSDRKKATVTGVKEVISFDSNEILLETTRGMLGFCGENLHVKRLTLERGEVDLEGDINELKYTDSNSIKDAGTFFGRLFR